MYSEFAFYIFFSEMALQTYPRQSLAIFSYNFMASCILLKVVNSVSCLSNVVPMLCPMECRARMFDI